MSQNPLPRQTKIVLSCTALVCASLTLAFTAPSVERVQSVVAPVTTHNLVLQSVHTLGDSGIATVKLNEFNIFVSFDFEASDYRTEINSLAIDAITDSNGKRYEDFTNHVDHQNINALLVAYIVGGAK